MLPFQYILCPMKLEMNCMSLHRQLGQPEVEDA